MQKFFKMRKLLAVTMAAVMCLSFVGCSGKGGSDEAEKTTAQAETTQTETTQEEAQKEPEFRELPQFELSDTWKDDTFSIDGKVFKLKETAVQDFIQAGFEIDYGDKKTVAAGDTVYFTLVLPENTTGDEISFWAKAMANEDLDIMDERVKVFYMWIKTNDLANSVLPEVNCGNFVVNDFTSIEDAAALMGTEEIEEDDAGNRQVMCTGDDIPNTSLRVKQYKTDGKIMFGVEYQINQNQFFPE